MLASLNFIEKYVSLPKKTYEICVNNNIIKKTVFETTQIETILTKQGFEVEDKRQFGGEFDSVVVGRIERIEKHPDATRLNICFVNAQEESLRQIICGARNVREGMYVAVALPGTKLPSSQSVRPGEAKEVTFEITSSTIRNVQSDGMLCARSELGLTVNSDADGDGIWDLSDDAQGGVSEAHLGACLGHPIFITLGLEDTLLDLSVTPNRPDVLSQQGVAREIIAGFTYAQIPFETKAFDIKSFFPKKDFLNESVHHNINVENILSDVKQNQEGDCGDIKFEAHNYIQENAFFVLVELTQSQVHTPGWMRNLLEPLNQNSINLLVDISNFILVANGQPNHAFDLNLIDPENPTHKQLTLRHAHPKECFHGLDGKEHILHESDCVVSDSSQPQALLGVLGGEHSKITHRTTKIALEFANPSQTAVRHTARRHAKQTVASFMFEKGIDIAARFQAAADFVGLLSNSMPEHVRYCTSLHSKNSAQQAIVQIDFPQKSILLRSSDQKKILGIELASFSTQLDILSSLGFKVILQNSASNDNNKSHTESSTNDLSALIGVPTWRMLDVVGAADLVEECIRIIGIDHVPAVPIEILSTVNNDDFHLSKIKTLCLQLCAIGYHEVIGLNFMRENDWEKLNLLSSDCIGEPVKLLNPIIGDEPLMQTTLIPDLLRKVERNLNFGVKSGQLFCSSRTFIKNLDPTQHPLETSKIAGICFGEKRSKTWQNTEPEHWTLHDIMKHIDILGQSLNIEVAFQILQDHPFNTTLHPKKCVQISVITNDTKSVAFGWLGDLHPKVKRNYGCENTDIYLFELNIDNLLSALPFAKQQRTKTRSLPRFPLISRDFSFIVNESITSEQIENCVQSSLIPIFETELMAKLRNVQVFDIYRGTGVSEGKKSVTFKVVLEPLQKTFTEQEIKTFSVCVVTAIARTFSAEQRV